MKEETLFEKDGFTMTVEQKWEGHTLKFTQWEAKYVSHIEIENEHLLKLIGKQAADLSWERDRYIRRLTENPDGTRKSNVTSEKSE